MQQFSHKSNVNCYFLPFFHISLLNSEWPSPYSDFYSLEAAELWQNMAGLLYYQLPALILFDNCSKKQAPLLYKARQIRGRDDARLRLQLETTLNCQRFQILLTALHD